jgi:transcriptional regulator with XRE-family HTH domain
VTREHRNQSIDPEVWQRADMRTALAQRDIATVFRLLQRKRGVSQRRIAALTGQSQSEISEILGGRRVVAYDVLCRIADGLGVARGCLGLAYDADTAALLDAEQGREEGEQDPQALLTRLALVAVDGTNCEAERWHRPLASDRTPVPTGVSLSYVIGAEHVTAQLRALDARLGGALSRDPVLAHLRAVQEHLTSTMDSHVRTRLHVALADLHSLAGWTSFDVGLSASALQHLSRAAEHARHAAEPGLVAATLCDAGRVYLHQSDGRHALQLLQLGQLAARDSPYPSAMALCDANQAWAYALLGDADQASAALDRARSSLARVDAPEQVPRWLAWFGEPDLFALTGTAHAALATTHRLATTVAVEALQASRAMRGCLARRALALESAVLSAVQFDAGDVDEAVRAGEDAVDLAEQVHSTRTLDLLTSLRTAARAYQSRPEVRDLIERLNALLFPPIGIADQDLC